VGFGQRRISIPTKRSTKAIPNNIPGFLFIATDLYKFNKIFFHAEKIEKPLYTL
jgi:predicted membrane protein